jgi:transcriptional regulator with XRE-family HTH domain
MTAVNNLLDKYREVCAITSDSALADSLKITRQGVHQWRKGLAWPSEDHVIAMAKAINEPAERWFVAISAERASPAGRKIWLKLLQAAATIAGAFVLLRHGVDAHGAAAFFLSPVYIMRNWHWCLSSPSRRVPQSGV